MAGFRLALQAYRPMTLEPTCYQIACRNYQSNRMEAFNLKEAEFPDSMPTCSCLQLLVSLQK